MKNPEKFWDRISKNYDNSSKKQYEVPSRPILATKPYLKYDFYLMDLGCATGKNAIELSEYVKEVRGIDISSKMIDIANGKLLTQNVKNVIFTNIDIYDTQLIENSFDVIVSYNVLHLLDDLGSVIKRISQLLKPGGIFISNTPFLSKAKNILAPIIYIGMKLNLLPNVKLLEVKMIEELLIQEKFEIIKNKKLDQSAINYFIVAKNK